MDLQEFLGWLSKNCDENPRPFGGEFELKMLRMRGFSSQFLDNQPKNSCMSSIRFNDVHAQ